MGALPVKNHGIQSLIVAVWRFDAMGSTGMNRYYSQQQKQENQSSSYGQRVSVGRTMEKEYIGQGEVEKEYIGQGEARYDSSNFDIDTAFPHIALKLQNLLGHFQKDFEGVDSAETLGSPIRTFPRRSHNPKFGDHGSFLLALEHSPSRFLKQKPLMPVQNYSLQKPTNDGSIETAKPVNADPPSKLCSSAKGNSSGIGAKEVRGVDFANKSLMTVNGAKVDEALSVKQGPILSNLIGEEKRKITLRVKVNSDSVSIHKNTAIYTDLGLQPSTSPSLESSPNKSQMDLTEAESLPDLSPFSIIKIMTTYEVPGGSILSPLPESVLELLAQTNEPYRNGSTNRIEKTMLKEEPIRNSRGSEFRNDMQGQKLRKDTSSEIMESKKELYSDFQVDKAKKVKNDTEKKSRMAKNSDSNLLNISSKPPFKGLFEENTETISASNMGKNIIKGRGLRTEESNCLANKGNTFLSKVGQKEADIYGNTRKFSNTEKELKIHCENETYKKQGQDQVKEARREIGDKDFVSDAIRASKESNRVKKTTFLKVSNTQKENNVVNDGAKGATAKNDLGQVVIHEKAGVNKAYGKHCGSQNLKSNINISKKATKGQNKDVFRESRKDPSREMYDKDSLLAQASIRGDKGHKESLKVTAKDFCGDGAKVAKNDQVDVKKVNVAHCKDILKQPNSECFDREPSKGIKKKKNRELVSETDFKKGQNTSVSKDHVLNIVDTQPLPSQTATQDPTMGPVTSFVTNDNWVCCDICEKWRLLPVGVEPSSLPKKWLCRMLNWLPNLNSCDVPEEETTQALYNLYGISQAQVQSEANQGKIELPAAVVCASVHDTKQEYQIQDPKAIQSSKKIGNIKKGVVQRILPNVSDTVKVSSSFVGKNELPSANSKNELSESHLEKSYGSIGLSRFEDEANLIRAEKQKHPVREEKVERISGSKDCNTRSFDVRTLKVKRKMDDELKESKSSKKAKTEASAAFLGHPEAVDLPRLKIKHSKPESKIFRSAEKANEDCVKTSKGDFLKEADPTVRVGPRRNDGEPGKLSGSKLMKFKDTTPKVLKQETSDCSLAGESKYKDQQQATKKRKLKEWKESQKLEQGLLETVCVLDHGVSRKEERETEPTRQNALMRERTEPCGSKGDGKKHKVKKLSLDEDTMLDEIDGKIKVNVIKEHRMEQSTGHDVMKKVSNGTEPSKKSSVARPSFVSTTSSSSKMSCYPKTLPALQDARESPVESSVSSSPLRNRKIGKFSLARGNGTGMHAMNDSGGRERKQFLKNKTKSENGYKQFASTDDVEHFAAECKQDGRLEYCTKHNDVDASYENSVGRVKSLKVQEREKEETVYRKKGGNMLDEEGREIHCFDSHSKGKAGTFPSKDGSSSLQHSSGRDRSSDWSLSERNVEAETNSNKVKAKASPHSANCSEEQCNDFGVVGALNKKNQLEGSVLDTCSRESSRIPRESGRSSDGALLCQMKPPMVNRFFSRDMEVAIANPIMKEHPQTAANVALREAKDLKQQADREKKNGGGELRYTDLYFCASIKFLHSASILELLNAESAKHRETHSMPVYRDAAKLCESCANTYQQNNDLAAAALAYKCMEVAHMRVVLARNVGIRRDQHELQVALQMIPLGESPSSSASDVDNLNNHVLMEKDPSVNAVKGLGSLPSSGKHVTVAGSHQLVNRILQHTSDVNSALEAFAKAHSAFVAVRDSKCGGEKISALKKVIDFSFHDVDELLHLVLLAMKATH